MKKFAVDFTPAFTPSQMLELGVFEGKYLNSTLDEYPKSWTKRARLSNVPDADQNLFGVKSRQPLSTWLEKGWIHPQDPFGWFQWYCRYYMGRRTEDDARQIARWRAFRRHSQQVNLNSGGVISARLKQRQALLQWSWDPFVDFYTLPGESMFDKALRISRRGKNGNS
jgi:hypothetical protein